MDTDALILVARVFLMALFVMTGWQKLTGFNGTVDYMKTSGVPAPRIAAIIATIVEFFFGVAIMLGIYERVLAWCLSHSHSRPRCSATAGGRWKACNGTRIC